MLNLRGLALALGVLLSAGASQAEAQTTPRAYPGRVLSPSQEPVAGVAIAVRGTAQVLITNADGSFLLPASPNALTLVVDQPGFRRQEITVRQPDTVLTIRLVSVLAKRKGRR